MKLSLNAKQQIAQIIREIDTEKAIQIANKLEHSDQNKQLILRGLALSSEQLNTISYHLPNSDFETISISYIKNLDHESYKLFLNSLPNSTREIGMVSCGLNDETGEILLNTVKRLTNLSMVCIEGNYFTSALKQDFKSFKNNLFLMI